jgi:hypothetical protein
VSWVGECPWTKNLCFGGEDGKLLLLPPNPSVEAVEVTSIQLATDAINAVAFADDLIAISSRNEVLVGKLDRSGDHLFDLLPHSFTGGAHGVVASRQGAFLGPIGDQGLLMLNLEHHSRVNAQITTPRAIPLSFYRIVRLGDGSHGEVFACAARNDGLLAINFTRGTASLPLVHHHFKGHDIVDVCPLNDPRYPFAVACVSRDRAIFFIRNVLEDQTPVARDFAGLQGTAYTLLSAQGHLLLLTDRELLALPNVGSRFLQGESLDLSLEIRITPVNAAEAFLLRDRSVLLIEENSIVSELMVADLVGTLAEKHADAGLARNGWTSPESSIEVTSVMNSVQVIPIESGWLRTSEFGLTSTPAA